MSLDDVKKIAILRRIKNYDKLSKEDLIYTLLISESNPIESNYEKYITNNTNNEIKAKINNIRIILARLGNAVTKNERNKIRKDLYKIEKKQKLIKTQKERVYRYLIQLANALNKREEYKHSDNKDLDYFEIRDIENLFIDADYDYYKPVLVKSSFENNYKYYEIRGDKDKKLSIKEYLYTIIPQLTELINERKNNRNEQKNQLSMGVNFMCITDKGNTRTFYVKSDNEDIRLGNDTSDIINELIESFLSYYRMEEQILGGGSNYVFDSVDILGIHFHDIKLKRGKSYIKSPDWTSSRKATINPKNTKDNKCFQYSITLALNHSEINNHPERISKIKSHIHKYNWKDINFPAGIKDWEKFERNNNNVALNILYAPPNKDEIKIAYKSKYNRKLKNQAGLLMITGNEQQDTEEKWHYIALKSEKLMMDIKNQ